MRLYWNTAQCARAYHHISFGVVLSVVPDRHNAACVHATRASEIISSRKIVSPGFARVRRPRAPPGLPGRQTWPPETRTRQSVKTCLPRDQSGAVNPPCGARPAGQSKGALEHADRVRRELRRGDDGHFAEADESALPLRERLRVERRLLREGGRRRAGGQNLRPGRGHPPTNCQTRHWSP